MESLAAIVPPVLMAIAFVAVVRAALRNTDGSVRRGRSGAEDPPHAPIDERDST